jgi:hypothetical protein
MLPPVLDVYVIYHPQDARGSDIAAALVQHFHGAAFSGLLGGGIEVYCRNSGWRSQADAPRPIPAVAQDIFEKTQAPRFIALVPLVGMGMARAVQQGGAWLDFLQSCIEIPAAQRQRVGIFPCLLTEQAIQGRLGDLLRTPLRIASPQVKDGGLDVGDTSRDLAQGIAQLLAPQERQRLKVFISHTKRGSDSEQQSVADLVQMVRNVIAQTRLDQFFDASELQPGKDWDETLRREAAGSALLAIRTDLYSSRTWCQREMLIAKQAGMPMVVIDALSAGEQRGSFLMDHVARIPGRADAGVWRTADVVRALNMLVDASLARELWLHQSQLARAHAAVEVAWWAPHAPEPVTLLNWLESARRGTRTLPANLLILHPDPPLGEDEKSVLQQIAAMAGVTGVLDLMTPRQLESRTA